MYWLNKPVKAIGIVLLALFTIAGCKEKKTASQPKSAAPPVVDVIVAAPQSVSVGVEANGTVIANEFVELRPEVSGRLIYLNVPEGSFVQAGTVIARVNDADLKAQLEKTKVLLDLAQKTEERYKKLLAVNGLNQSDYDVVQNQVSGYKADIAYTQALIDKTVVKAPFSGVVGLKQVSPGAFVTTASIIATMQQVNKTKIDFTLPEEYSNIVRKGGLVDIVLDSDKAARRKARIIAIEPQVNQATRNLVVRAILEQGTANPGSFAKVYLTSQVNKNAIMVPTNCIIPDDKNKQLVLVKDGKAVFANVETGIREANNVEVVKGVNPGDSIVVTGVLFARPKAVVKVRNVKKLTDLAGIQ
ncbi:MAG: efflux RND transporter periplasmic adaptor subunit [Chitinophagaceae bacterium]